MTRRRIQTAFAVAAVTVAAILSSGCGGGDDQGNTPQQVAQAYANARSQSDAAALCHLYTPEIQQQTEPKQTCVEFVRKRMALIAKQQKGLRLSVMRVDVQGNTGAAVIATEQNGTPSLPATIPLARVGEGWRVAGFDLSTGL